MAPGVRPVGSDQTWVQQSHRVLVRKEFKVKTPTIRDFYLANHRGKSNL